MNTSVASDLDTAGPSRGGATKKLAIVSVKLLVTVACFWYLSRQVDTGQVYAFAAVVVVPQIPLVGLRWCGIVDELAARSKRITLTIMVADEARMQPIERKKWNEEDDRCCRDPKRRWGVEVRAFRLGMSRSSTPKPASVAGKTLLMVCKELAGHIMQRSISAMHFRMYASDN